VSASVSCRTVSAVLVLPLPAAFCWFPFHWLQLDPSAKMDFLKDRVGVEVEFGHSSFLGIDLLKFQVASYSALDKIDVGV
jgi:Restriction endonuclease BglII